MEITQKNLSKDQLLDLLIQKATATYGQAQAQAIRPSLEQMAQHLKALNAYNPDNELTPAFFL